MSLKVEIFLPDGDTSRAALATHLEALSFFPGERTFVTRYSPAAEAAPQPTEQKEAAPEPTTEPAVEAAPKRGRPRKAPNITARPENRIEPDSEQDEAQDAEDEAADAPRDEAITLDSLRGVVTAYINMFGTDAAMHDGVDIFRDALGDAPDGADYWNVSRIGSHANVAELLPKAYREWKKYVDSQTRRGA